MRSEIVRFICRPDDDLTLITHTLITENRWPKASTRFALAASVTVDGLKYDHLLASYSI